MTGEQDQRELELIWWGGTLGFSQVGLIPPEVDLVISEQVKDEELSDLFSQKL